ncbi:MAG: hypothetical protein V3S55_09700 [Nitrospiraceae bacterium]
MSDTSTRQRLLELWEKCPECRPVNKYTTWDGPEKGWFFDQCGSWVGDKLIFALARDAMTDLLMMRGFDPKLSYDGDGLCFKVEIARADLVPEIQQFFEISKTDGLISAVEAVIALDAAVSRP